MTKIEALGNKEKVERKASEQDWEGTTMTKHEAVQQVSHLPKDSEGLVKSPSTGNSPQAIFDTKPDSRSRVPFQPPPQSDEVGVGLRKNPNNNIKEQQQQQHSPSSIASARSSSGGGGGGSGGVGGGRIPEDVIQARRIQGERAQAADKTTREPLPGTAGNKVFNPPITKTDTPPDLLSYGTGKALDVASKTKEALQGSGEMKNRALEKGEEIKDRAYQKGQELKNRALEKGEEIKRQADDDWAKLEAELSRNKQQQQQRNTKTSDHIVSGIKGAEEKVVSEVKDFGNAVAGTAKDVKEGLSNWGGEMKEGAQKRWEGLKEVAAETPKTVKEKLINVEEAAKEKVLDTKDWLWKEAKEDADYLKEKAKETVWRGEEMAKQTGQKAKDTVWRGEEKAKDAAWRAEQKGKDALYDTEIKAREYAQRAKEMGTSSIPTSISAPPASRPRSSSLGEAIDRAFTTTPDTNRPTPTDLWTWGKGGIEKGQKEVITSKDVPLMSDESETRRILKEQVLQEEQRSPGFVASMVEFVFGPTRNPDLSSRTELSEKDRLNQRAARINSMAYSPAGAITPSDLEGGEEEVVGRKVISPGAARRHSIAGGETDEATMARRLDRLSTVQYSPASGVPYEVSAKEKKTGGFEEQQRRIHHHYFPNFNTYDDHHLPLESRRSSYFQTYRTPMQSEEVEERVLESTIDFFY